MISHVGLVDGVVAAQAHQQRTESKTNTPSNRIPRDRSKSNSFCAALHVVFEEVTMMLARMHPFPAISTFATLVMFQATIHPAGHFDPDTSTTIVDVVVPLLFGSVLLFAMLFWWRSRALSNAQKTPPQGQLVVEGTVETDASNPMAVRIELDQAGSEVQNKGVWSHYWKEFQRRVLTQPFVIVTNDGRRVRVEPDPSLLFVAELAETKRLERALRTRAASLKNGDHVLAVGVAAPLGAGVAYRANAETIVLRGTTANPLVLSTERLSERFERRAAFHRKWSVALVTVLLAVEALFFFGFHLRRTTGEPVDATITRLYTYTTTSKGRTNYHYVVEADAELNGATETLSDEVPYRTYETLRVGRSVHFLVPFAGELPGSTSFSSIGEEPTLHVFWGVMGIITALGLVIAWPVHTHTSRPWFDRKRWNESGQGSLSESKP